MEKLLVSGARVPLLQQKRSLKEGVPPTGILSRWRDIGSRVRAINSQSP